MTSFKLLQLNTWHGGQVFQPLIDFLQKQDADILHLQEVYSNEHNLYFPESPNFSLFQYIQQHFDYPYAAFSKTFDIQVTEDHNIPMGNATFSRYPIEESHTVYIPGHAGLRYEYYNEVLKKDFSLSPANFLSSTININGNKVKSINMHGVWGFDGLDNERRFQMRDLVLEEVQNQLYVVCSGDFNTVPTTDTMRGLDEKLTNVFTGKINNTFNNKRWKHGDLQFVVDYVYLSPNIEILNAEAPQADISDHMPLVVEISL